MQSNRPVILQVLPALGTGGVERGTIDMAHAIVKAGGIAVVASADGLWAKRLEKVNAIHVKLPLHSKNPFIIWKNHFELKKIIQTYHVDIIHARSRAPAWSAWLASKKTNIPLITTWHGVHSESWFGKRWYNQVMIKGKRVIAISNYIAQKLHERYQVNPDNLRIIPRGVDLEAFNPDQPLGERVNDQATQWGISENQRVILLPGRLTAWKGHELLIRAFAQIKTKPHFQDWICVFAGPSKSKDQYVKRLLTLAEQLQIKDYIYFVGNCQDMVAGLMLSTIVVVPSLKPEPFGRVVIEAQAMEKPVIVANHGGAAETVEDGKSGYIFTPGNVDDLAWILQELMQKTEDDLHWIGRLAREEVQKHYTLEQMQQATLKVYNEVLPPTGQLLINE